MKAAKTTAKYHHLFLLLIPICVGVFSILSLTNHSRKIQISQPEAQSQTIIHITPFSSKNPFEEVLAHIPPSARHSETQVVGGILPHHLLAAPLIASFFRGLEDQQVTTVVVLGPNHRNLGNTSIATSKAQWQTPYGTIQPDLTVIKHLLQKTKSGVNEKILKEEHAIFNILPFIRRIFPNAKVVPLLLSSVTSEEEAKTLGLALSQSLPQESLVIASVDFSHNVSPKQAAQDDQRTLSAISNFSFEKIYSQRTDSNASIYTLIAFLKTRGATETLVLENANSAEMANQPTQKTVTSYATVYFTKEGLENPALSLDAIFSQTKIDQTKDNQKKLWTLMVTGDINLGRSVNATLRRLDNPGEIFKEVAEITRGADLTIANLEAPLLHNCPETTEGMKICGNSQNALALAYAGIDVVSLANNHAEDYGTQGITETKEVLLQVGIAPLEQGKKVSRTMKGINITILGYDIVKHAFDGAKLEENVKAAKKKGDIVLVMFHWGKEYTADPIAKQKEIGHLAIESGADLVVGNHPHWAQALEIYKNRLIVYSHGNFVFDQLWSEETREGVIGQYTFSQDKLIDVKFLPIWIDEKFQPTIASQSRATKILNRLRQASERLSQK